MEPFPREDVLGVLGGFGITGVRRAEPSDDAAEEVVLVPPELLSSLDVDQLTLAVMKVIPHTKVWVVPDAPQWSGTTI